MQMDVGSVIERLESCQGFGGLANGSSKTPPYDPEVLLRVLSHRCVFDHAMLRTYSECWLHYAFRTAIDHSETRPACRMQLVEMSIESFTFSQGRACRFQIPQKQLQAAEKAGGVDPVSIQRQIDITPISSAGPLTAGPLTATVAYRPSRIILCLLAMFWTSCFWFKPCCFGICHFGSSVFSRLAP